MESTVLNVRVETPSGKKPGLSQPSSMQSPRLYVDVLHVTLLLSLAVNVVMFSGYGRQLIALLSWEPPPSGFCPPCSCSPLHSQLTSASAQTLDDAAFLRQLVRAEEVYERHMQRKSELVGTTEELTEPFPEAAMEAVRTAHLNFDGGVPIEVSLDVFRREFFIIPRYPCFEEERVGLWGEGGKWLCRVSLHKKPEELVVYSVGSQGECSFEKGVFELLGAKSHTFDPTLNGQQQQDMEQQPFLSFYTYGLGGGGGSGVAPGGGQLNDIHTIMGELNHSFVDLFKIDCEGCELQFVEDLAATTTRDKPVLGQILMEIHNFTTLHVESRLLTGLRLLGYRMFHMEPNLFQPGNAFETAFIHESVVKPATYLDKVTTMQQE